MSTVNARPAGEVATVMAWVGIMLIESAAELLLVTVSPPPDTEALLVTDAGAFALMLTPRVIGGYAAAEARLSDREHVNVDNVQVQPEPDIVVTVIPVGSVSVTLTGAVVARSPELRTVSVKVASVDPALNVPE